MGRGIALLCLALMLTGCTAGAGNSAPTAQWIQRHGGEITGSDTVRVQNVAAGFDVILSHPALVHVLASNDRSAWSWPSGDIFITHGLVQSLNDDEIAAVIGHELGHLLKDGHTQTTSAFTGVAANTNIELTADLTGVELLHSINRPATAMRSSLQKLLANPNLSEECRFRLKYRISHLP